MENGEPRRFMLTMGGAGAQRELFKAIVDHCRPMIEQDELTLFVNLGDHADNWEWLHERARDVPGDDPLRLGGHEGVRRRDSRRARRAGCTCSCSTTPSTASTPATI